MRRSILLACLAALVLAVPAGAGGTGKKPAIHKITQSASYLMIDPIYTTIMDGNKIVGLLMIGIGLDVPNADLRSQTEESMPVLRDVYVRSLMAFTATSVRPWRQPDVGEIADRLQRATDRTLGRQGARILLAQVAIRLTK
jgi:flagellar basal body-associated protein FliL